ncbi:MAG: DUF6572 domain-containing protein [Verrucomicrobiota bacterium]
MNGLENPGVLDAFAHDTRTDKLVLAMYENRPWLGEEPQLLQLQEKLNAYLSFVLDGEMKEAFPQFVEKSVEIQLRTLHEPEEKASDLIRRIREQLAFQEIGFEVIQMTEDEQPQGGSGGWCGSGCGCH